MIKDLFFFEMGLKSNKNFIPSYLKLTVFKLTTKFEESSFGRKEIDNFSEDEICIAGKYFPSEASVHTLRALIQSAEYPKFLIAFRLLEKSIQIMNPALCLQLVPAFLESLLVPWFNRPSRFVDFGQVLPNFVKSLTKIIGLPILGW